MSKFTVKLKCGDCGHVWKRTITVSEDEDPRMAIYDPPCPACKRERKRSENILPFDPSSGRAPPAIGSVRSQAYDQAAEIIMHDHGMTDIKGPTDVRQGEACTPKIHPVLQAQADAMFAPKRQLEACGLGSKAGLIARQAMAGSFSPAAVGGYDAVAAAQSPRKTVTEISNIMNLSEANAHSSKRG